MAVAPAKMSGDGGGDVEILEENASSASMGVGASAQNL
jgi:hypothetical protein